jgi:ferric-dicitrate binding protein FerR (iron transport regulator)
MGPPLVGAGRIEQEPMTSHRRNRRTSPEASPDDTSLLGLAAVWSELNAPMPPKRRPAHRHAGRRARRPQRSAPTALIVGLAGAVLLALLMIVVWMAQLG